MTVSKLGVAKNFPEEYLHTLLSLQGLEFSDVEVEQGIQKMGRAWTQGDTGSQTGDLLQINLEAAQLEVGVGTPLLEMDFDLFGCLPMKTWIKGLWAFLWKHRIIMGNRLQPLIPLQCIGDQFIMERVVFTHHFSAGQLLSINRCRLRLQVATIADIIAGNGVDLRRDIHTYMPSLCEPSKYKWPKESPAMEDWRLWRYALKLITSQNGSLPLFEQLGGWIAEPHIPSEWVYSTSTQCLYQARFQGHYCFVRRTETRASTFDRESWTCDPLPADVCPVTAYLNRWGIAVCTGWANWNIPPTPAFTTIQDLIDSWDAAWPLHHSNLAHAATLARARQHYSSFSDL